MHAHPAAPPWAPLPWPPPPWPPPAPATAPPTFLAEDATFPLTIGIAVTAFAAEFLFGLSSFGPAITFHVGFHLMHLAGLTDGTIADAITGMVFPEMAVAIVQALLLFRGASGWLFLCGGGCLVSGLLVGLQLLTVVGESVWLKRGTGLLLLAFGFERARAMRRKAPEQHDEPPPGSLPDRRDPRVVASVVLCYGFAGLLGGLTGVIGPPLMLFVAFNEEALSMQTYRSTGACIRLALASVRLAFLIHIGAFDLGSTSLHRLSLVSACTALCGLALGNAGNARISPVIWRRLVLSFLFISALMLATADVTEPLPLERTAVLLVLGAAVAPGALLLASACARCCRVSTFRRGSRRGLLPMRCHRLALAVQDAAAAGRATALEDAPRTSRSDVGADRGSGAAAALTELTRCGAQLESASTSGATRLEEPAVSLQCDKSSARYGMQHAAARAQTETFRSTESKI